MKDVLLNPTVHWGAIGELSTKSSICQALEYLVLVNPDDNTQCVILQNWDALRCLLPKRAFNS